MTKCTPRHLIRSVGKSVKRSKFQAKARWVGGSVLFERAIGLFLNVDFCLFRNINPTMLKTLDQVDPIVSQNANAAPRTGISIIIRSPDVLITSHV